MHSRLYRIGAALAALTLTAGCVQMTRHSNMVVFGTNTSVGARIGASATSVPEIQVGYSRQEAVVMPVVANTSSHVSAGGTSDLLHPCNITGPVTVYGDAEFAVHPCSLVAINGSALDSYSVLASFGADFNGSATTSEVGAKGGLAQYFATGMAAQMLALNGGAAVVAIGEAAAEASEHPVSDQAVKSLFGNAAAFQKAQEAREPYADFEIRLLERVTAINTDQEVASKIENFEDAVVINTAMRARCATKAGCITAIEGDGYRQSYLTHGNAMETALDEW